MTVYSTGIGWDTSFAGVVGNTGQNGDEEVGREDHHGALSQVQEDLQPEQSCELDLFICRGGVHGW